MKRDWLCRPQLEEMEQRAAPAPLFSGGHLVGCHPIRETITTELTGGTSGSGNIPGGLLQGHVTLSHVVTSRSFLRQNFGGTLTITTPLRTVRVQAWGSVNLLTGS